MLRQYLSSFLFFACAVVNAFTSSALAQSASGAWSSKFPTPPGANGAVHAMTRYGTNLIVAGQFTEIAGVRVRGLAKFDGQIWSEFGGGVRFDSAYAAVYTALADGNDLYIGGWFDGVADAPIRSLARWRGDHWEPLGAGLSHVALKEPIVYALHKEGTNLYVGGSFTKAGGLDAFNIARWDGARWHSLGDGAFMPTDFEAPQSSPLGRVNATATDGANVYVGGFFFRAGNSGATNLAKWNGSAWQQIGNTSEGAQQYIWEGEAVSGFVNGLAWHDGALYVAGDFTKVAELAITNIARWNGSAWDAPISASGAVNTVLKDEGDLYVTGSFSVTTISGASLVPINLLRLRQGEWTKITTQLALWERINVAKTYENFLFIGGSFTRLRSVSAGNIARRTLLGWQAIGSGVGNSLNGTAQSIATDGTNVYASGYLTSAGTIDASDSIARWDGATWTALPAPGPTVSPAEIAVVDLKLYLAGQFTIAELAATNIIVWDGQRWSAVDYPGANFLYDYRFLVVGSNLYSSFTNGTKWWDGSRWHNVPWPNDNAWIERLGTDGTNLFIARNSFVGGARVARWDGVNLFEFPSADLSMVSAIGASGTNLFIAGGRLSQGYLLGWNGSAWIGHIVQPTNAYISSIVALGEKLIAAGSFTSINGVSAASIAQWDGAQWRPIDIGVRLRDRVGAVWDVAVAGSRLYLAGEFDHAGPNSSGNIALWHQASDVHLSLQPNALNQLRITGGTGDHIQIEGSDSLANWTRLTSFTLPTTTVSATDPSPIATTNRFYRVRILEP